jgi:hypothetical protein
MVLTCTGGATESARMLFKDVVKFLLEEACGRRKGTNGKVFSRDAATRPTTLCKDAAFIMEEAAWEESDRYSLLKHQLFK